MGSRLSPSNSMEQYGPDSNVRSVRPENERFPIFENVYIIINR